MHISNLSHLSILGICFAYGLIKESIEFIKDKKYKYEPEHRKAAFKKSLSDICFYALFPLGVL